MMKAIVLIALVLLQVRSDGSNEDELREIGIIAFGDSDEELEMNVQDDVDHGNPGFKLKSTSWNLCYNEERLKINELLSNDDFFSGMKEVKELGEGSFGLAVEVIKQNEHGNPRHYVIKVGDDTKVINYVFPGEEQLNIPVNKLNLSISGVRITDYLRAEYVPFISNTITYRHLIFANPADKDVIRLYHEIGGTKDYYPISKKFVSVVEYGDFGDLDNFAKSNKDLEQIDKKALFLDIFYKIMLAVEGINSKGIIHGDIKEINTFLKSFNGFGDNIAPIMGDWDFAQVITRQEGISDRTIYTYDWKPPDMHYFTEGRYLDIGPTGYTYNGKEDIYACAVTMMGFANKLEIEIDGEIEEILLGMAYPVRIDELEKIVKKGYDNVKSQITKRLKRQLREHVHRNDLLELSVKMYKALPALDGEMEEFVYNYKRNVKLKAGLRRKLIPEKVAKFMEIFMSKFANDKDTADALFASSVDNGSLDADDTERFFDLVARLRDSTSFPDIKERRSNHEQILKRILEILHPEADDIDTILEDDKQKLRELTENEYHNYVDDQIIDEYRVLDDGRKSDVCIDPSLYDFTLNEIESIFKNFNNFRLAGNIDPSHNLDIPNYDYPECYESFNFGKEIMFMINEKKAESEDNMARKFKDLYPAGVDRKLKNNKQRKAVRKENNKTII